MITAEITNTLAGVALPIGITAVLAIVIGYVSRVLIPPRRRRRDTRA